MLPFIYPDNQPGGSGIYHGFSLGHILYYTTDGTFDKADYPGLRALRIRMVGGGGGAGGCAATGADQWSAGAGGGGGAYAEALILATALATSETVTRGDGGTAGGVNGNGGTGQASSFGTLVTADGGGATNTTPAQAGAQIIGPLGGAGGQSGTGDLIIPGGSGGFACNRSTPTVAVGFCTYGGSSVLSGGQPRGTTSQNTNGSTGDNYGGGGKGGQNSESQAAGRSGGAGGIGIVIVELLY